MHRGLYLATSGTVGTVNINVLGDVDIHPVLVRLLVTLLVPPGTVQGLEAGGVEVTLVQRIELFGGRKTLLDVADEGAEDGDGGGDDGEGALGASPDGHSHGLGCFGSEM